MRIHTAAGATLALALASPAVAAPYPVPNATAELRAAVDATNAAPSYRYRDNHLGWTAAYNAAGQYQAIDVDEQRVFDGVGTFHAIRWPSTRVRDKVRGPGYLDSPALQWELIAGVNPYEFPQWSDVLTERYGRISSVANADFITVADKSTAGTDTVYRVGDGDYFEYVYTVNADGRITRLELSRGNRTPETGTYETWEYVPVTVAQPGPAAFAPISTVQRAIQAATLGATIRDLARRSADTGNRRRQGLRTLREWTREAVVLENAGVEGGEGVARYVRIKVGDVASGVRIFRRNPYTGTAHEWRITKRGATWRATRTRP